MTLAGIFNGRQGLFSQLYFRERCRGALNRICVTNKHRMLVPIVVTTELLRMYDIKISGEYRIPIPKWDRSKNEIVYLITGPKTASYLDGYLPIEIAFDDIEIVGGKPAVTVLNDMVSEVENILEAFEGAARVLGLIT